eukprot:GHVU01086783.1.p1 GENE.GHVU01086783.1~~GHVU01086783.1.p1  ORF type:complete len:118 (+),score=5.34 GHVU01086783.1:2705-3058(+)
MGGVLATTDIDGRPFSFPAFPSPARLRAQTLPRPIERDPEASQREERTRKKEMHRRKHTLPIARNIRVDQKTRKTKAKNKTTLTSRSEHQNGSSTSPWALLRPRGQTKCDQATKKIQ